MYSPRLNPSGSSLASACLMPCASRLRLTSSQTHRAPHARREPVAADLLRTYRAQAARQDEVEAMFGPEHTPHIHDLEPVSDAGPPPELPLQLLDGFGNDLREAVRELQAAGVGCILMTIVPVANDTGNPVNGVVRNYSKAIRAIAAELNCPLVDSERAFRDVLDRAATYKQKVAFTGQNGELNAQGQTLLARTFLDAFGLLPPPGWRPVR